MCKNNQWSIASNRKKLEQSICYHALFWQTKSKVGNVISYLKLFGKLVQELEMGKRDD